MFAHKTIGVIGLGSIGMRHAKNLLAMGHQVIGYDPDDSRCQMLVAAGGHLASRHDVYSADACVVASPTIEHWNDADEVMDRCRPVFVEKPVADQLHSKLQFITMVGTNLRFHSCVKHAKSLIVDGMIGKPLWASFVISQHNTKYTDPVVLNWGAHECDLALYFLGPAMVTTATGNDQMMDVCLLHEYGVPSFVHMDYLLPVERRGFVICGDKGNLTVDLVERFCWLKTTGVFTQTFQGEDSFDENYIDEMQAFIDLIDGKPVPHAATGADGLATLELILEAQRMAAK